MSIKDSIMLKNQSKHLSFGGYLRVARTMRGLTQTEMAKYLNISRAGICDIEKGRQIVSLTLALKIAQKCRLSPELALECAIRDHLKKSKMKFDIKISTAS